MADIEGERVMGILGHELRNPLSAITALARVTGQREDLAAEVRERLAQIERAAARSLAMVESLLDFSESRWKGALATRPVLADPVEIAGRVIEELRAAHPDRVIALEVESRAPFELDPVRIEQVLSNLIGNALVHGWRYTPVEVSVDVRADEASLTVRNQGPVIPRDEIASLFQPFTQGGGAEAERPRGLGLGLYIVRQIVEAHAGEITVDSTPESTTFRVRLPRRS
jgi:signal transduction histidine kinase